MSMFYIYIAVVIDIKYGNTRFSNNKKYEFLKGYKIFLYIIFKIII